MMGPLIGTVDILADGILEGKKERWGYLRVISSSLYFCIIYCASIHKALSYFSVFVTNPAFPFVV